MKTARPHDNPPAAPIDGPRYCTLRLSSVDSPLSILDAKHYQEEFTLAKARVSGCGLPVRAVEAVADALVPGRTKLVATADPNAGAPYLRAHDILDLRPTSNRFLSRSRTKAVGTYVLQEGILATPASGRNLGPMAYVGAELAHFAMTDIIRILPHDRDEGYYLYAYLLTPTGQALIRRGRTGTNVDHLAPADVLNLPLAWPDDSLRGAIARAMRKAEKMLDEARRTLRSLDAQLHDELGLDRTRAVYQPEQYTSRQFSVRSSQLSGRLDAEFYSPDAAACRSALKHSGADTLESAAKIKLLSRYKRYYVSKGHGVPILSSSQSLQLRPVNLRYISPRSFSDPEEYKIKEGWTLIACDGRAEKGLGTTAFVHRLWDGWMAGNHSMRLIPREHMPPGYLYLAVSSPFVQVQLKARATGSVVDALDPTSVDGVLIPMVSSDVRESLGSRAEEAWRLVSDALSIQEDTVRLLEDTIVNDYETLSAAEPSHARKPAPPTATAKGRRGRA